MPTNVARFIVVTLCMQISQVEAHFAEFYKSKHPNCVLKWQTSLATAVVQAWFPQVYRHS